MASIFPKLFEILPDVDCLLSLEPEELAGPLLVSLEGSDSIIPIQIIAFDVMSHVIDRMPGSSQVEIRQRYPPKHHNDILFALMEAWQWLEREGFVALKPTNLGGDWSGGTPTKTKYFVTRRGKSIKTLEALEAYRKSNLLPKRQLHPIIAQKVWSLFLRGDYDTAVFQAFKEVEVAVRKVGNYDETDLGVKLMRKAFHIKDGNLTNPNQQEAEKQARSDLFAGAIGSYKNPSSHREIDIKAEEAAEIIVLASHLLRIVDSRKQASSH